MSKIRLDVALVERGLVASRSKAQALVMAGRVRVNGELADKPGTQIVEEDDLVVTELEHPWVGRGGMKLAAALDHFGVDIGGRVCVDIGASTGGFTDVMLQRGADKVYAIDVGYGQLDQKLREDSRVVVRERINARYLDPADFEEPIDFAAVDVSFISLRLILPAVSTCLSKKSEIVALVKPQFEVGRGEVGKGGIVRDVEKRERVLDEIVVFTRDLGFRVGEPIESPIRGSEGNVEYLIHARRS